METTITKNLVEECIKAKSLNPLFIALNSTNIDEVKNVWNNVKMYGRFHIASNYDTITPSYYVPAIKRESYVDTVMDLLNMNPLTTKKGLTNNGLTCSGTWEKRDELKRKSILGFDDFGQIMSSADDYCQLVFVGMINMPKLWEILEQGKSLEESVVIPKDTRVLLFNDWQGWGGFFQCESRRYLDLNAASKRGKTKYDRFVFKIDEGDYSTKDVYGYYLSDDLLFI